MKSYKVQGGDTGEIGETKIIQDCYFNAAATKIRFTPNRRGIVSCGFYQPCFKVFSLDSLGLVFERNLVSDTVWMEILEDDWTKLAFMQDNKKVEFHNEGNLVDAVKLPWIGKGMFYCRELAEIVFFGLSSSAIVFDLERGEFTDEFVTRSCSLNAGCQDQDNRLFVFGDIGGVVSIFDSRQRTKESLSFFKTRDYDRGEITTLSFHTDHLTLFSGTNNGCVAVYDIRSKAPLFIKDLGTEEPVTQVTHKDDIVLSSSGSQIQLWNKRDGIEEGFIENKTRINDFCLDEGYVAVACEEPKIQGFYVPVLGCVPGWCSAVEKLVDSDEEEVKQKKEKTKKHKKKVFLEQDRKVRSVWG